MAGPVDAAPGEGGAAEQAGAASLVFRAADLESRAVRLLELCLCLSEEACQPEGTRPRDREWHRVACPTVRSRRSDHHAVPPPSPRDGTVRLYQAGPCRQRSVAAALRLPFAAVIGVRMPRPCTGDDAIARMQPPSIFRSAASLSWRRRRQFWSCLASRSRADLAFASPVCSIRRRTA